MNRREFLVWTGVAGGAAALAPLWGTSTAGDIPEFMPGLESWTSTTCLMCPGGCGLQVRRIDGMPVGLRGNVRHPVSGGGVCTEGVASLQLLYHPDRLRQPLRRIGGKRSNGFEPVTWDEALSGLARSLKELHAENPQRLSFVLGRTGGSMEDLVRHFMAAWGSNHLYVDQTRDGYSQVFEFMHGLRRQPAFDFDNTALVLAFGADLLDSWQAPVHFQKSYSSFRAPARSLPASLVVADVRFSRTAAQSHDWVGLTPGSYGALALGVAYVMLREKLYDAEFVEQHVHGFEDFTDEAGKTHMGFSSLVLQDYSPEVVSRLTGVAVERILALGKSFGESPTALAIFGEAVAAQPGGIHAAMAVHSLNILKGNINRPGGIYLQPDTPLKPLTTSLPAATDQGPSKVLEDLSRLGSEETPGALFLYYSNPSYSSPLRKSLEELFEKIPLIVSFSPFMDETSRWADLLLPDSLFLERWEDRLFPSVSPACGWSVVQPTVSALGTTRHSGDVVLELARRLESPIADAFPWKNFEELLKHRAHGLYETRSGTLCNEPFQQGLVGEMERRGWWSSDAGTFEDFWQKLLEAGAWTDPNYQVRTLRSYSSRPDGKIDLFSRALQARVSPTAPAITDVECLPHYHSPEEPAGANTYSMILNPYRPGKLDGGTHAALPWILQQGGALQNIAWNSWAEIHPVDARNLGIANSDWIWVESAAGKIKVRALIYPGTGQGMVNIPYGLGHNAMGRWAERRGVNPIALLDGQRDRISGLCNRFGTKVRIYKA